MLRLRDCLICFVLIFVLYSHHLSCVILTVENVACSGDG